MVIVTFSVSRVAFSKKFYAPNAGYSPSASRSNDTLDEAECRDEVDAGDGGMYLGLDWDTVL